MGGTGDAAEAYDRFAPVYDDFNAANDYEIWLGEALLPELEKHGLKTGRVLDVGCGTGRAFDPLWRRGWEYWGCDLSSEMLRVAKAQARPKQEGRDPAGEFFQADARDLPGLSRPFDLVLLLNDVVNYLTEDGDLERCFGGVKGDLAPGGMVCFDANTLGLFQSNFAGEGMTRGDWTWRGDADEVEPGGTYDAILAGPGVQPARHRQRHWTESDIRNALATTGLTCIGRLGQREELDGRIVLEDSVDEERDVKTIYIVGSNA